MRDGNVKKVRVLMVVILVFLLVAGCVGPFQAEPVNYEQAGQVYLEQWLAGLRQAVIESCSAQPDPTGCRAAWRSAVDAVIDPRSQPAVLQQVNGVGADGE